VIITLYLSDKVLKFQLPTEKIGSYTFGDVDGNTLINVEARNGEWCLYSTSEIGILFNSAPVAFVNLIPNSFYVINKNKKNYLVFVSNIENNGIVPYTYDDKINLLIGMENANIKINCIHLKKPMVSIKFENNKLILDKNDNALVYSNGFVVKEKNKIINYGDEVELYGIKMLFTKKFLFISNNEKMIFIDSNSSNIVRHLFKGDIAPQNIEIKDVDLYKKDDYFSKTPRIQRTIYDKEVKLSSPPKEANSGEMPLILVIGPMLAMGVSSIITFLNTILKINSGETTWKDSYLQLITSGVMLISMLIFPLITQLYNKYMKKKKRQELELKYTNYLQEKEKELEAIAKEQSVILYENLITNETCIDIIKRKNINFWAKRVDQNDFLVTRIGMGKEKLKLKLTYSEEDFSIDEDVLRKKADALAEKYQYIENVPVGYSFYESKITAIMGSEIDSLNFVNNIILQLVTFYNYEELKLVLFTNPKHEKHWNFMKYLNHSLNDDKTFRFFSTNFEDAKNVTNYLNFEMNGRNAQSDNNNKTNFKPHYIVIIDGYDAVKNFDFFKEIMELEEDIGFSFIIIENKLSKLPSKCSNFIMLDQEKSVILKNSYESQEKAIFKTEIKYDINMMDLAKILSNVPIEMENDTRNLPDSLSFLEMEHVGKVEQLNILNRWNMNDSTSSLRAEVGVDDTGSLMYLDLHEKYHGPHGLIAGMTGSGKSEFIITYILSMAINYSPDDVAFILIDYKGGGLAGAFENKVSNIILPHLAGTITNLDKAEMDRTLVSIDSEIKRRQQMFNEARDMLGESTIDIYKYQSFYKNGKLKEPLPHLFIISDEFAELKSQQPDFMDNLISVARIGRSLGVHLILATQKPSGVVNDQIWSNTKFRVCLKVQDLSDSREMLKRPEAASIKQTGRFYLQVGYDEYFALGQSAWCGAKYYPYNEVIKQADKSVNFINNIGYFIKNIQGSTSMRVESEGEQLAAVLNFIIESAKIVNKKARKLWLDNISPIILVDDLEKKYQVSYEPENIKVLIGEYDAPEKQEQGPVIYDYLNKGNTIIYGNNGAEMEMLLNCILYNSCKNYSAQEINFYIIDYGSESFRKFENLPHVGGVVFASEEEEFNNLLKLIKEEIEKRKKLFSSYGGDYKNYIKSKKEEIPLKVIIINNYSSVYDAHQNIYDDLPQIVRDSERYGVIFILTGNGLNSINSKITQLCHNFYAFKLKDSSDYSSIFGVRAKILPRDDLGRGLLFNEGIHEFQTASIVAEEDKLNDFILSFVAEQINKNKVGAFKVPVLPEVVDLNFVKEKIKVLEEVPVGVDKKELGILTIDYLANIGNIITSNKIENTKNFVLSLIYELRRVRNTNLIVLDPLRELVLNKQEYPNYVQENMKLYLKNLGNYIQKLIDEKKETNVVILIYSFAKFMDNIDGTEYTDLLNLAHQYEKVSLIIVDAALKIKKYTFESWFTQYFNNNEGIWIGRGIADQSIFRLSTVNREMTSDYKNDMGWVVSEGIGTLVKLIDFIKKDDQNGE